MWILESRGDFFQGRRMWLKPGKQYLFGRVKKDGVRFALDHKTVSRKHFIITIDAVKDTNVGNVHARTTISITDQGSKTGTLVNGQKAKPNEPRALAGAENVLRIGTCQEEIIVRWQPVVLTFNLLKKELKSGLLFSKQERIRELDIKAISDYIPGTSTFLVVNKRNTAKGLQALIDGKHLVAESFIDALEYAATPTDLEEEENLSPLELDFDKAWPNPAEHLPPQGKEPTVRADDSYMPNPTRGIIFSNYTFVFCDQTQHDNLLPPITTGHGKALLYPLVNGETTPDELITYMRQCAGRKSFGDNRKESDEGAVILVRWASKNDAEWTNHLINEVALKIDQRAIEQSEFLDAILANDASVLRQSVPFETLPDSVELPPSTAMSTISNGLPDRVRQEPEVERGRPRLGSPATATVEQISFEDLAASNAGSQCGPDILQPTAADQHPNVKLDVADSPPAASFRFSPRMKMQSGAFDDDFDEDAVIPFEEDEEDTSMNATNGHGVPTEAASDSGSENDSTGQGPASRKRSRSAISMTREASDAHELDEFLPNATAIKRRKLAQNGTAKPESPAKQPVRRGIILPKLKANSMQDLDVKEELRVQRQKAQKERETKAEDDDEEGGNKINYDDEGNIVVYEVQTEYTDLPLRPQSTNGTEDRHGERWDPRWNGRKNFKAFRRARDNVSENGAGRRRAHTRVIVPLVDAKEATYGIGDQYWERTDEDRQRDQQRKKRASQRTTQSQQNSSSQAASRRSRQNDRSDDSDMEDNSAFDDDDSASQVSPRLARLQQETAEILDDDVDIDQPRRTRADDARTQTSSSNVQTQTQRSSKSAHGTKRPASTASSSVNKRQKTIPVVTDRGAADDSDDGNDLKFKFGRGRRGRGRGRG